MCLMRAQMMRALPLRGRGAPYKVFALREGAFQ